MYPLFVPIKRESHDYILQAQRTTPAQVVDGAPRKLFVIVDNREL